MSSNRKQLVRLLSILMTAVLSVSAYLVTVEPSSGGRVLLTGKEEHRITTEAALRYVANHSSMEGEELIAGYMSRKIFEEVLSQPDAMGIRIYNARHDDGAPTFVIVGVDKEGNDLMGGVIGQQPAPCPPFCGNGLTLSPGVQPIASR
ncbi:MAG TPA: hypothetical protein VGA55_03625 [Bacteroidota bacterium]